MWIVLSTFLVGALKLSIKPTSHIISAVYASSLQIGRDGREDTALYVPNENYILDYKGRSCLLIYGQDGNGQSFDQFAVGNYGIEGKEGTFRDAEDGELSVVL